MRELTRQLTQPARLLGAGYLVEAELVQSPLRLAPRQASASRPEIGEHRVDPILRIDVGSTRVVAAVVAVCCGSSAGQVGHGGMAAASMSP